MEAASSYIKKRFSCEEDRQSETRTTDNRSIMATRSMIPSPFAPRKCSLGIAELQTRCFSWAKQYGTTVANPLCCFYLKVMRDAPPDRPPGPLKDPIDCGQGAIPQSPNRTKLLFLLWRNRSVLGQLDKQPDAWVQRGRGWRVDGRGDCDEDGYLARQVTVVPQS